MLIHEPIVISTSPADVMLRNALAREFFLCDCNTHTVLDPDFYTCMATTDTRLL
jgi:hypothetical protein